MSDDHKRSPRPPQPPSDVPITERGGFRPQKPTDPPPVGIKPPSTPPPKKGQ